MDWIFYGLLAVVVLFFLKNMLPVKGLEQLSPDELKERLKKPGSYVLLDVREPFEYRRGHIPGFSNLPLGQLRQSCPNVDPSKHVILTCQSGMRSRQAAKILLKNGVKEVSHLQTGMSGWTGRVEVKR
ncbi:rhodanese-like domain-containing protein [Brevibacillus ruminantium]|uniref:Rhodanese-like domain-containing protein n=1 Tax=Brevibacillus ruminantium TaxID=2950604 RepID=A0ABY4WL93_9BACL|nr:rhodanese-like domain-containing protein [Brevibacillus ruminantium]USG66908.1 rhodanese-like domain-containing protein [Brevibacillus ruminantium]